MNDRAGVFLFEVARNSASASISDFALGTFSSRSRQIFFGTAASIKLSRTSNPSSCSIVSSSLSFGPMWRRVKESDSISSPRICMEEEYKARTLLQVCRAEAVEILKCDGPKECGGHRPILQITSCHKFRRRGFSTRRAARPDADDFASRPCNERARWKHPNFQRRDRARLV